MADQSNNCTNVQLDEPVAFIEATYKNMGKGSFIREQMIQRYPHHQSHHGGQLTKAGNLKHTI